ncbi:beta strand repeat-containing protein, partial [Spirosoma humi]
MRSIGYSIVDKQVRQLDGLVQVTRKDDQSLSDKVCLPGKSGGYLGQRKPQTNLTALGRSLRCWLCLLAMLTVAAGSSVYADGTANIVGSTNGTNLNQLYYAYANAGEYINYSFTTGTPPNSGGTPNTVTIKFYSPTGLYTSRTMTAQGQTVTGAIPVTAATVGIWTISMEFSPQGGALFLSPYNIDVTTTTAASSRINGRVYSESYWMIQTSGLANINMYMISEFGYKYSVVLKNYNGIGSRIQTTRYGVRKQNECTSVYKSVDAVSPYTTGTECGGIYKQFFTPISAALPASAPRYDLALGQTVSEWLQPPVAGDPTINGLTYTPSTIGNPAAGTFTASIANYAGNARLQIDVNNNGVYTDAIDRSIPFNVQLGANTINWDGINGQGGIVACGTNLRARIFIDKVAEIHFTFLDVEVFGGLTVTRTNGPGAPNSTIYWDDTSLSTANRTLTSPLSATAGINSNTTNGVHGWPNVTPAQSAAGFQQWGNNRYIDSWTNLPNASAQAEIPFTVACDFGDAPDSYATLSGSNGAAHKPTATLYIGALAADGESNGQPTGTLANGDDTNGIDDEDGLTTAPPVLVECSDVYSLTVEVTNTTGQTAYVRGWVDFNRNGTFDTGEFTSVNLPYDAANPSQVATLTWGNLGTLGLKAGQSYIRLRVSTTNFVSPTGTLFDGEVEDYPVSILPAITFNALATDASSCSVTDGSVTITATGSTGSYEYSLNGVDFTPFASPYTIPNLGRGGYRITVRDRNFLSCLGDTIINVKAPGCCDFFDNQTITGTPFNPGTGITVQYVLTNSAGQIVSVQSTPSFPAQQIGDYYIYTLAYDTSSPAPTGVTVGQNVSGITGCCYRLYPPDPITVCGCPTFTLLDASYQVCAGQQLPQLRIGTTAVAPSQVEFVYFTTQQTTAAAVYGTPTGVLGAAAPVSNTATLSNVDVPGAPGTYYVYARITPVPADANCRPFAEIPLSVSACCALTGTIDGTTTICSGEDITLTATSDGATGTLSYQWTGPNNFSTVTTTPSVTIPNATTSNSGSYTVVITDNGATNCSVADVITILVRPAIAVTASANSATVCAGSPLTLSTSVIPVAGTYTYAWTGPNNYTDSGATPTVSAAATVSQSGTYTVVVTDANGCLATATVTVSVTNCCANYTLNQIVTSAHCGQSDGGATVTVSGGTAPYVYAWSTGASTSSVSGLAPGSYSVMVTDAAGCSASTTVTVGNVAGPQLAVLSTTPATCLGATGAASVTATGGTAPYTYLWSTGATTSSVSGLVTGTYSVSVTDASGCRDVLPVVINSVPGSLTSTVASTPSACGQATGTATVTASGGTTPYTYLWSNGATTNSLTGLVAGVYSVTVTDANGCVSTGSVTISDQSGPSVVVSGTAVSCNGTNTGSARAVVSGGTAPYTYLWSNGASTSIASGLAAGNYNVVVTDANGCKVSGTVSLTQPAVIVSELSASTIACGSTTGSITVVSVVGGTAPYSYGWSNGATSQNLVGVAAGPYSLTVTDANGCTAEGTATLVLPTNCCSLTATGGTPIVACAGSPLTLTVTAGNSTTAAVATPLTYAWSGPNSFTATVANPTLTPVAASAGVYSVTVTDASGCSATATVTVSVSNCCANFALNQITSNAHCGQSDGGATITATGGTAPYTYVWSTGASTSVVSGLAPGSYSVTVTDAIGCSTTALVTIGNTGGPQLAIVSTTPATCLGATGVASVTATGGTAPYTYLWSTGATGTSLNGVVAGTYSVTVTDAAGCRDIIPVTINSAPGNLTSTVASTPSACGQATGTATVTASGGTTPYTYLWSNGATTNSLTGLVAGVYSVTVTDANGCVSTGSVTISDQSGPSVVVSGTAVSCNATNTGSAVALASGGTAPYTYLWNTGAATASISGLSVGTYNVVVTDANGCKVSGTVSLTQPAPIVAELSASTIACGSTTGSITIASVVGGTAPYTYLWSNGSTSQNLVGVAAGPYSVTVTDSQGCTAQGTATLVLPTNCCSLTATAGNPIVACVGSPLTLTVTAGNSTTATLATPLTYVWTGPNGFTASIANPILAPTASSAGVYSVTVTDALGCTAVASLSVTVTNQPNAGEDKILSLCNNETLDLSTYVPAGGSFTALSGSLTGSVFNGIASGAGSYTVIYSVGGTGCPVDQAFLTILVRDCTPPLCNYPISAGVIDATCGNSDGSAMVSLGGLPAGATTGFAWSNGKTGPSVSGLAAGVYSLTATVTTTSGVCQVIDSVQVNDISGPVAEINLITAADCRGNNGAVAIDITTGNGPFMISWSGAATGSLPSAALGVTTIPNLAPGSYIFKITSTNSDTACASYLPITIPQSDGDQISVTAVPTNATACGTATGSIVITAIPAVGVAGPFSYSLNGIAIGTSALPTFTVNGLAAGVYTVGVSSAGGCSVANVPVTILDQTAPAITGWSAVNPLCPSDRGQLVFAGGQPTATFLIREVTTGAVVGPTTGISGASSTTLTLPAGTYSIEQTGTASNCTSLTTVTITVPEGLKFNVQYTKVSCAPGGVANNDGTISIVQITGGTAPYSTTVLNAQNQLIASSSPDTYTNLKPGVYQIRVLDSRSCLGVETIFVTVPDCQVLCPIIPMNTFVVDANCTAADGRAVAQLGNLDVNDVDYLWSNGFSGANTNGLAAGIYSVTATVLTGPYVGCPYVETINVNQIGGPIVSQGIINPSSCAASTGTVAFSITSGTGPFAVSWTGPVSSTRSVNGTAPFQFTQTGLAPGLYTFTFTSSNSTCKTVLDVTIPVSSSGSIALTATPNPASSCGAQDGSINLTASGSGPVYTYLMNGTSFTTVSASTIQIPSLPAGVYTVGVVSGANSCSTTTTVIVPETGAPPVTGWTSLSALCAQGTGSLTYAGGTGTGTYRILLGGTLVATVPENTTGPLVTNVPQGIYTVEYTNGTCTSFRNFTVVGPSGIDFNVQYIAETCGPGGVGNGDGTLNVIQINGGTPAYTVSLINNQGQTIAGASHSNLAAGNYFVSVVDANGCPGNQNALVTVPPCPLKCPPLAFNSSVIDNQCGSANGEATAQLLNIPSGATTTYVWSNGQNGPIASGLMAGVYSVTANLFADNTIYAGCQYVDTVNVNDIGGPVATIQATAAASCTASNGSVALNIQGGTGPYSITWTGETTGSQSATNPGLVNITGLKAGDYVFTVSGANSTCKSVIDVHIQNRTPNGFVLTVTPTNVSTCDASDGKLTISVSGGTGPFTYSVNGYVKGISSGRSFTVQGLPAGTNTVTVTDANGCEVTRESILINPPGPAVIAGWTKTDAQCPQENGLLQYAGSGSAADEYVVTIAGTATEIGRTPGNVAATYTVPGGTYLLTRTTSSSCVSVTTIIVNQPDGLDFNIQYNNPVCLSPASGSLTVVQPAGGTAPYSYTITGSLGVVSNAASVSNLLPGSYTVTFGDSRGCRFSDVITLTTGSNLTVTGSATPGPVCIDSPIALNATATGGTNPLTYNWSGPNGFTGSGQTVSATAAVTGAFTVVVTDAVGCSATAVTAPVTVTLCQVCQDPVLTVQSPVCDPVTGLGVASYFVSNGASVSANVGVVSNGLITGIPSGSQVIVTATNGCGEISRTVVTPGICTTCTQPINLVTGNAVCANGISYVASVTATAGATITAFGGTYANGQVTGTVGSSVTVVASVAGCASQTQVIGSPTSCTNNCQEGNPLVSISGPVCDGNGSTYRVQFTAPTGVTVTASAGVISGNIISGISLGTSLTLTAVSSTCSLTQVIPISAPTCPPVCQNPVLTVTGPVCDPVTGLSSVSFVASAGASVTANVGVVNALVNTITGLPANTNVVVSASVAGGCVTTRTVVTGAVCTTCTQPIALQTGNAVCVDGVSFVASVTASPGATLVALGGTLVGNQVTGTVGSSVTVVASLAGCASQTQVIGSPASCTTVDPCQAVNPL